MTIHWNGSRGFPHPPKEHKEPAPWNLPPWDHRSFFATERCVTYVLEHFLGMKEGVDYLFQKRIPVRGISQTGMNRSDFWMLSNGKAAQYGVGAYPYYYGRILNPIASTLLIHNPNKDRRERSLFRAQHYDEVFMLDFMLFAQPRTLVELALQGVDRSGR